VILAGRLAGREELQIYSTEEARGVNVWSGHSFRCMTLSSFASERGDKTKTNTNSGGQECPPHM